MFLRPVNRDGSYQRVFLPQIKLLFTIRFPLNLFATLNKIDGLSSDKVTSSRQTTLCSSLGRNNLMFQLSLHKLGRTVPKIPQKTFEARHRVYKMLHGALSIGLPGGRVVTCEGCATNSDVTGSIHRTRVFFLSIFVDLSFKHCISTYCL